MRHTPEGYKIDNFIPSIVFYAIPDRNQAHIIGNAGGARGNLLLSVVGTGDLAVDRSRGIGIAAEVHRHEQAIAK
jgi:hypothetical protein